MLISILLATTTAISAMQRALDSSAQWRMERTLANSTRKLITTGEVRCKAGQGIAWEVLTPFKSSVTMSQESMTFADEDGSRTKQLDELPRYADIRKATDSFVAGNTNAFDGVFSIKTTHLSDGGWRMTLVPEVMAMKSLFTSIELSGSALPTNAILKSADGGVSIISFKEL